MTFALSRPRLRRAVLTLIALTVAAPRQPPRAPRRTQSASAQIRHDRRGHQRQRRQPGHAGAPLRTIQRAVDLAQPGYTIFIRGGTYAPSTNIQLLKNGTASQPITMRNYNGERVDHRRREHAAHAGRGGLQHPPPGARRHPHRGRLLAADRPGDHPRPVRHLRPGHQQQRLRPPDHQGQLRVRPAPPGRLEQQPDHQPGQLRQPRPAQQRRERRRPGHQGGLRHRQRRARRPAVEQLRRRPRLLGCSPRRSWSRTAWPGATASTAGTCPNYTGDGNGFKLGGGDGTSAANHTVRNSMAWDNAVGGFIDNDNPGRSQINCGTAWTQRRHRLRLRPLDLDGSRRTSSVAQRRPRCRSAHPPAAATPGTSAAPGATRLVSTNASVITGPRASDGAIAATNFLVPKNYPNLGATFA